MPAMRAAAAGRGKKTYDNRIPHVRSDDRPDMLRHKTGAAFKIAHSLPARYLEILNQSRAGLVLTLTRL
jgi:hypothetical protein